MRRDGRNPYGSRGGYVDSRGRRDRMRGRDARSDYEYRDRQSDMRRGDRAYSQQDYARDYGYDERDRGYDSRSDYNDMRGEYRPIEAMGYFSGYYGGQDRRYDRGNDYNDYGDYEGDYGETLTKEELKKWEEKLMEEVDEPQAKQFFKKENVEQKARQMGVKVDKPEELAVASLMVYTDYCKALKPYIGSNMDIYIKMGDMFLNDKDSEVKGGEKLALYHDLVSGE